MYGRAFFGAAYYGPRYWGDGGGEEPPPAPVVVESSTGGWQVHFRFEQERMRIEEEEREARDKREAREQIEDETARDIARFLAEQEAKDAERAQLDRLAQLAREFTAADLAAIESERLRIALERAREAATYSALMALQREMLRAMEEEELAILNALLLDD